MTLGGSRSITQQSILRQEAEPTRAIDGLLWINPAGGANGNNSERYIYNQTADAFELTNAVGPDTPSRPAEGALWRDTSAGQQRVYDGGAWTNIGVTDHANLTNVTAAQHHAVGFVPAADTAQYPSARDAYNGTLASVNHGSTHPIDTWADTGLDLNFDVTGEACVKWSFDHRNGNNNSATSYRLRNESSGFIVGPSGDFTNTNWVTTTLYADVAARTDSGAWAVEIYSGGDFAGKEEIDENKVWFATTDNEVA